MAWMAPWLKRLTKGMEREMAEEMVLLLKGELEVANVEIVTLGVQLDGAKRRIGVAYAERNLLVCALSKLFPSYLSRHTDEEMASMDWDEEWGWVAYINGPAGQMSWHIRTSELEMFDHLCRHVGGKYDGHTTEEKYRRLSSINSS